LAQDCCGFIPHSVRLAIVWPRFGVVSIPHLLSAVIETMSADELVKELVERCAVVAVWKDLYPLWDPVVREKKAMTDGEIRVCKLQKKKAYLTLLYRNEQMRVKNPDMPPIESHDMLWEEYERVMKERGEVPRDSLLFRRVGNSTDLVFAQDQYRTVTKTWALANVKFREEKKKHPLKAFYSIFSGRVKPERLPPDESNLVRLIFSFL